ncbi:hypothetical protein BDA99DRAFT_574678 [Phascolomyces articulosus]|uniref:Uncharacterized protein n=1 Tax=Phascolomyces articulosus TaxID=60185 RepID=A0AAD5JTY7_9FUNG|nr:hypothetical protein BDA99DRAFT_574678 [Phascolomyces articulosus]
MDRSNPQQKQKSLSAYKVVIAYDFGTTYSGAAYAFNNLSPAEVFDIQNWPQKDGNFYPKVPTVSVYPRTDQQQSNPFNRLTLSEWGHRAKKAMLKPGATKQNVLLSQFKLQLDDSLNRPPLENGLMPVQAVADYLSKLHQYTLEELKRGFANNYHSGTFRYCLTVPAVWSDKAKSTMRQAAIQAGIITPSDPPDRLLLVSEPEAAAIYCEKTMADQVQLKDKDRIMICDAGGGTVDLIVFQVHFTKDSRSDDLSAGRKNNRELKEVAQGIGESCGSVYLDHNFQELLKKKLGKKVMRKVTPREMYGMMEYFIGAIKPDFNGVDDHFVELPRSVRTKDLPASVRNNDDDGCLDEGMLKLSGQELKDKVFDPVIDKVLSLIDRQFKQIAGGKLNFLFLVGGFGSSKYLYQRVRKEFHGTKAKQIACPSERAALAVVRGATYYGLNPRIVVSRVSRRAYGVVTKMAYEENIDPVSKRVVNAVGEVRCTDRFQTYIQKNEELPVDHCVSKQFRAFYGTRKVHDISLYATENDTIPRYCDDPGVHRIGVVEVPIPKIPNMKKNETVNITIRMYFGRTEILMEAEFKTGEKHVFHCDFDAINNYGS